MQAASDFQSSSYRLFAVVERKWCEVGRGAGEEAVEKVGERERGMAELFTDLICRPPRRTYTLKDLGPVDFLLEGSR